MTNRSANESIKGYSYQFDHTLVKILECNNPDTEFVVEGVEDVDVLQGDLSTYVQCKYYEGTDYNHSEIKPAIIAMLRHFHKLTNSKKAVVKYKLYGHFKSGQEKLEPHFSLDVLKKSFLSYKNKGITHIVYDELGLTSAQLELFRRSLDIDLHARTYNDQRAHLTTKLLIQQIPSCTTSDEAQLFFYPSAATIIQSLAVQSDIKNRRISKSKFVQKISKKDMVFNFWLQASFDSEKYAKVIKKNHFMINGTKRPKAARLFALEVPTVFDLEKLSGVLTKLATTFSHKEHRRTPESDRFCPYVLLRGISEVDLTAVKKRLHSEGLMFDDGYQFRGAEFNPEQLAKVPTKENLYQLKLLSSEAELMGVFNLIEGTPKKIYDFYIATRMSEDCIPSASSYDPLSIEDLSFITKIF
jgi:hypothetical protein